MALVAPTPFLGSAVLAPLALLTRAHSFQRTSTDLRFFVPSEGSAP